MSNRVLVNQSFKKEGNNVRVILASQSPRRKELLQRIVPKFEIVPALIDERRKKGDTPKSYVQEMAYKKAQHVAKSHVDSLVIGCDTIVALGNQIVGKPSSREEAFQMLKRLSGKEHEVYTSVVLLKREQEVLETVSAKVLFYELSDQEINRYLDTSDYLDKAGAYGIQEQGALFVKEIKGDYYSIMGLPIATLYRMLPDFSDKEQKV